MAWSTSTGLLYRLSQGEDAAWRLVTSTFREPIFRFCRHMGLPAADADDATQQTMLCFVERYRAGRYDRRRGRLSKWLFGIARNRVLAADRSRSRRSAQLQLYRIECESVWDREFEPTMARLCLDRMLREFGPRKYWIFHRYVMDKQPSDLVAAEFGISAEAVRMTKHRALARLKELRHGQLLHELE